MNKCDFCKWGPCYHPDRCSCRGGVSCSEAAERYMKVCMSRNHKTTTHNKNVNVHKNYRKGKNR